MAELQQCLAAAARVPAGASQAATFVGAQATGYQALAWPRIRRIVDCPAACVEPLAKLCPNAEAVSVFACAAGGVPMVALRALAALTELTQLSIAGARDGYGDDHPPDWSVGQLEQLPPALTELRLRGDVGERVAFQAVAALTGLSDLALGYKWLKHPTDLAALARPNLASLTSLEAGLDLILGPPPFHNAQLHPELHPSAWPAPKTALVRLSLPRAGLCDAELTAIAAAAQQLTFLPAKYLNAPAGSNAPLPRLAELACCFSEDHRHPVAELVPALHTLELCNMCAPPEAQDLYGGVIGVPGTPPLRVVLASCLAYTERAFDMLREAPLAAVELKVPLDAAWAPVGKGGEEDRDECLMQKGLFTSLCGALHAALTHGERAMSLRAEGGMLQFLLLAAAHAPRVGALQLELMSAGALAVASTSLGADDQVAESIAAAMCFRELRSLELVFAPWAAAAGAAMTDAHLEQIARSRPPSLTRLVLRNARHVTPDCAALVMRRAREEGRAPVEVTLTYGEVDP